MDTLFIQTASLPLGGTIVGELEGLIHLVFFVLCAALTHHLCKRFSYIKEIEFVRKVIPIITVPLFLIRFIEITTHTQIFEPAIRITLNIFK